MIHMLTGIVTSRAFSFGMLGMRPWMLNGPKKPLVVQYTPLTWARAGEGSSDNPRSATTRPSLLMIDLLRCRIGDRAFTTRDGGWTIARSPAVSRRLTAAHEDRAAEERSGDGGGAKLPEANGEERVVEGGGGDQSRVRALAQQVVGALRRRDAADGEDGAIPGARLAPGQHLLHLAGRQRPRVRADDRRAVAPGALEGAVARLVEDAPADPVDHDEAVRPRGQLGGGVVEQARRAEDAELRQQGPRHRGADAIEDLRGQRNVLVDHLRLLGEGIRDREMHLDAVGARLGRPRGAARVILDELLGVAPRQLGADDADEEHLAGADLVLGAPHVLPPDLGLGGRHAHGHGERRMPVGLRAPRRARRVLVVLHGTDVRQRVRGHRHRAHGLVGEDVVAEPRVPLDPLRVQERAGGDAEARVQLVIEELAARAGGKPADARQRGSVAIVPRVRAIHPINGLSDGPVTPRDRIKRRTSLYQAFRTRAGGLVGPTLLKSGGYLNAGMTSRAISSSSVMMCACGIPGKNVRQIRCVMP